MDGKKKAWMDVFLEIYLHMHLFLFVFSTKTSLHKLSVFVGKNAINETDAQREQELRVSELFIHEHFDNTDGNYNNDIGNTDWELTPLNPKHANNTFTQFTLIKIKKSVHINTFLIINFLKRPVYTGTDRFSDCWFWWSWLTCKVWLVKLVKKHSESKTLHVLLFSAKSK